MNSVDRAASTPRRLRPLCLRWLAGSSALFARRQAAQLFSHPGPNPTAPKWSSPVSLPLCPGWRLSEALAGGYCSAPASGGTYLV